MRIAATFAVFFVCALVMALNTEKAEALSPQDYFRQPEGLFIDYDLYTKQASQPDNESTEQLTEGAPKPEFEREKSENSKKNTGKIIRYKVKDGDTLTGIADEYGVKWQRIFYKNKKLKNPHSLKPNQSLVIPKSGEKLKKREIPKLEPITQPAQTTVRPAAATSAAYSIARGSSSGNTYYYGYCTWYVKSRRPDLPNNLGNANTWASRAAAQGIPTGSSPKVGAAAMSKFGVHVAYVEKVHGNGKITVREMNYQGWGVVSSRTANASDFLYIY